MATAHRLRHYVGVLKSGPAYIRDTPLAPMDVDTLAPYVASWLGAEGQEAFYRQIAQKDPRYTDEVQPLTRA